MKRVRADVLLVQRGLAESREGARRLIVAGSAQAGQLPIPRPATLLAPDTELELTEAERFVSRGGLKLQAALDCWGIDLSGRDCLDIGASTGGFTDCMLRAGATSVLAVDVGHGQMHRRLLADPRVTLWEGVNARDLPALGHPVSFFAMDLSFISVRTVLPAVASRLVPRTEGVVLVKPQFEVGRDRLPRTGVVRDARLRQAVVAEVADHARSAGWTVQAVLQCPVEGGDGNIEYLAWMRTPGTTQC